MLFSQYFKQFGKNFANKYVQRIKQFDAYDYGGIVGSCAGYYIAHKEHKDHKSSYEILHGKKIIPYLIFTSMGSIVGFYTGTILIHFSPILIPATVFGSVVYNYSYNNSSSKQDIVVYSN